MKFLFPSLGLAALLATAGRAEDVNPLDAIPAKIESRIMKPEPLVESPGERGWNKVPAPLLKAAASVYMPVDPNRGLAEFTVTADGMLLLACNYDHQGSRGAWESEAWSQAQFLAHGWHLVPPFNLQEPLITGQNRTQVVFVRWVMKGETYHLRCNKHDAPFPIVLQPVKSNVAALRNSGAGGLGPRKEGIRE